MMHETARHNVTYTHWAGLSVGKIQTRIDLSTQNTREVGVGN